MKSWRLCVVLVLAALVLVRPPAAHAQRLMPAGVVARETNTWPPNTRTIRDTLPPGERGTRIISGGVVGLLAGALVGAGTAYIGTHQSATNDHSYDPIAYGILVPAGAVVGLVIGAVVGALR